ncbi:MAG: regulatory protein RecX [Candidatus Omnitrophica bacterium]|nr:regulatory protein RecX [Candidatus Omnitrophota bacterium]
MDDVETEQSLKKAKGYALRLFKLRPRSEAELKAKLAVKGFTLDICSIIVDKFKVLGFIDDAAFARVWMQGRLKKYGFSRVARELAQKGIAKEIVTDLWESVRSDHDEVAVALAIVERRGRLYRGIEPRKRKKRMMDYLARRGFSAGTINKVIREI